MPKVQERCNTARHFAQNLAAVANGRAHQRRGQVATAGRCLARQPRFRLDLQGNLPATAPPHCSCAHWRLALPATAHFLLDHVNIYLIADDDGWCLIDTGLGDKATERAWTELLAGPLSARPLNRIIVTHFHPDHVGAAGWLLKRFDVPLYMSATEYLLSLNMHLDPGALEADHYRRFYRNHGLDDATTQNVVTKGHEYLRIV